ncbi:uncharacterized protein [Ptychodera flava]|uniref:uncharacterized protein n=1 Tax=Ptychodera flava TaxID=63121 RepID=UPI003969DC2E
MFGIRTTEHTTTKYTPFMLMYNRAANLPSEVDYIHRSNSVAVEPCDDDDREMYTQSVSEKLGSLHKQVLENIEASQEKQKESYRKRLKRGVKTFKFKKGDEVLKLNARKRGRQGGKMEAEWTGPYIIEGIEKGNLVTLRNSKTGDVLGRSVAYDHLKPYLSEKTPMITSDKAKHSGVKDHAVIEPSSGDHDSESVSTVDNKEAELIYVKTTTKQRNPEKMKVKRAMGNHQNLDLMVRDIETPGQWLTDSAINHSQALLQEQFPAVDGLQDVGVITAGVFVGTPDYPFVQILNIHRNHWITISNFNCQEGTVKVYDSMASSLDGNAERAIAWMLYTSRKKMTIQWPTIHKQVGCDDCGLFAIANATALCHGNNPAEFSWQQDQMRGHLVHSFRQGKLDEFPCARRRRTNSSCKSKDVKLYCHCRQPDVGQADMVLCTKCKDWYHGTCERVPETVWCDPQHVFTCSKCRL